MEEVNRRSIINNHTSTQLKQQQNQNKYLQTKNIKQFIIIIIIHSYYYLYIHVQRNKNNYHSMIYYHYYSYYYHPYYYFNFLYFSGHYWPFQKQLVFTFNKKKKGEEEEEIKNNNLHTSILLHTFIRIIAFLIVQNKKVIIYMLGHISTAITATKRQKQLPIYCYFQLFSIREGKESHQQTFIKIPMYIQSQCF